MRNSNSDKEWKKIVGEDWQKARDDYEKAVRAQEVDKLLYGPWPKHETKEEKVKYSNLRKVKIIKVIEVEYLEGKGVIGDPIVSVKSWHTLDGKLIGSTDKTYRKFRAGEDEVEE